MTKVLYLTTHLRYGGAEVGLLTTLKNIDRDRFDCSVVSIEKKGAIGEEIEGIGIGVVYMNSTASLFNLGLIWKMADILKRKRPDVLHTSLFYANFFGRMASLFSKPKAIITEERSMYTEKKFYHVIIDRLLSAMTDRIIVCSKSVLDFTMSQEKIGRDKFLVMYNAVDDSRFELSDDKNELRASNGFGANDFIVGTVGSLIPKKGHKILVEACGRLKKHIPGLRLLVVGDGPEEAGLKELAIEVGLGRDIAFPGARRDIPELMKIMDIFVLPSFQEGFPRTVVEAMFLGLPVIASAISGIPEIVIDGDNGFLTGPGDSRAIIDRILQLYKDPELRNTIGLNARRAIRSKYMPQDYAKNLEDLYINLCVDKN